MIVTTRELGEPWDGKACGPGQVTDPIPPTHYGVESLWQPEQLLQRRADE
jgi:hypothetical protein